jgi:hypothetical protein
LCIRRNEKCEEENCGKSSSISYAHHTDTLGGL